MNFIEARKRMYKTLELLTDISLEGKPYSLTRLEAVRLSNETYKELNKQHIVIILAILIYFLMRLFIKVSNFNRSWLWCSVLFYIYQRQLLNNIFIHFIYLLTVTRLLAQPVRKIITLDCKKGEVTY